MLQELEDQQLVSRLAYLEQVNSSPVPAVPVPTFIVNSPKTI